MNERRCVIIGGAEIRNYERIRSSLRADDYLIFCDSGLKHREGLQAEPSLIVGDFDSYQNPHSDVETIVLPCEKDDTDTVYAVKEGLKRGFEDFLLLGVTGGRMDHTLGNIYILEFLDEAGKKAVIADDYSEMQLVSGETEFIAYGSCAFFSLLNITGTAKEITVTGAKYCLQNAEITSGYQYGVSNEVAPGKTAAVSVKNGKLLLIKVFREACA
ncbi:MAG: thiamine diphosphokinase [Lachnospiraceae bacterium]|nr:thiamine diphosphokinase [Lachnospiraceae bacterium]